MVARAAIPVLVLAWLLGGLAVALTATPALGADDGTEPGKSPCKRVLQSDCDASQEDLFDALVRDLKRYGLDPDPESYPGEPPALQYLPKDRFGRINWTAAVADGIIRPKSNLEGDTDSPEGFFDKMIMMQVESHFMADVLFPHGIHSYWLSCDSCHPDPFKAEKGGNEFRMQDVVAGRYCGKCHGTVAFPIGPYENCRRCHAARKQMTQE